MNVSVLIFYFDASEQNMWFYFKAKAKFIVLYCLGMNFSPLFPSNFGDFSQNISTPTEHQQPLAQNPSGKTEYMAFPKPFESSSSIGAEKQRYLVVNVMLFA